MTENKKATWTKEHGGYPLHFKMSASNVSLPLLDQHIARGIPQ